MTRNEADMAFKRRVKTIFDFVEPDDGMRILDLPCGRGFYLNMFRHVCDCDLVGADLDWSVVKKAGRALRQLAGIHVQQASIYAMPYPGGCFDAVILSEVLEHIDDDVRGLREAFRVLKPGGVLAVTVPNANYPFSVGSDKQAIRARLQSAYTAGAAGGDLGQPCAPVHPDSAAPRRI